VYGCDWVCDEGDLMFGRKRAWQAGVVALLMLTVLSQAAAAISPDSEGAAAPDLPRVSPVIGFNFRISGATATSDDRVPAVAHNRVNNQYLVVWQDGRNTATRGRDIFGQLHAADGTRIGFNFRISGAAATSDEWAPAVAYNPVSNQYLVVWQDGRNTATRGQDIYGRRVKAGGRLAGGDFRISGPAATSDESYPDVAYNPDDNQYLVVWRDGRNTATRQSDIYGRRVKAGGRRAGGDFRISGPAATSDEYNPAVAYSPIGSRYLVVWQDGRNTATRGQDIYGQRVKAGGRLAGGDFRISGPAATSGDQSPAVAHNPFDNQHLVVWNDPRKQVTRGWDIFGQRVAG